MKRSLSTREKVLLGLLAVVAVILYRAWSGGGVGFGGGSAEQTDDLHDFGEPPVVRMDLLAQSEVDFDPQGRNLFDYYTPPPPRRERRAPPPPPQREQPPPRERRPPPPPPPLPQAQAPKPSFRYLGFLGPKESKIAVFDPGEGEPPTLARIGDVIEDEFKLVEFKYDAVVMGYTDDRWEGQTAELQLAGLR